MSRIFLFLLLTQTSLGSSAQSAVFEKRLPQIDRYIDSVMKGWNIPGLAIGIVYNNQLIYSKGFGFRDIDKKLPVDTGTLFPIASNTKLFTATAASIMATEGKINLDKPIRNYLPQLVFSTDELNAKASLRDLLSHRTGLPRYDGIWTYAPFPRDSLLRFIPFMKPQLTLREGYIYNNVMYACAGIALEKVAGSSWENIIRQRILQPLHMTSTCFTLEELQHSSNYSLSYFETDSSHRLLPLQHPAQSAALGPAGTIKSNIADMSHWMIAQLNAGLYNSVQAIPAAAIRETLVPNSIADKQSKWEESSNSLYCLGRIIQTYKGIKITSHTGSIDGFYSSLVFAPREKLAIFTVFNSSEAGSLRSVINLPVLDILLAMNRTPWIDRYRKEYLEAKTLTKKEQTAKAARKIANTNPSHPLLDYVGSYHHPVYGEVNIQLAGNGLAMQYRGLKMPLHHFHYDQFATDEKTSDLPDFDLEFSINEAGKVESLLMDLSGEPAKDRFVKPAAVKAK